MIPKFRAWHKKENRIVEVSNLDFTSGILEYDVERTPPGYEIFENVELLAFTGLHDRNKEEIYNLDVVKIRDSYYLVVYRFGGYNLTCIDHKVWGSPYFYGWRNQLERVCSLYEYKGAVHIKPGVLEVLPELGVFNQSPELLKKGES